MDVVGKSLAGLGVGRLGNFIAYLEAGHKGATGT
jgi:hypothetical protein